MATQNTQKQIKVGATVLVLGALLLLVLQGLVALPLWLQGLADVTKVVLAIHMVEGLVAAVLIFRYKLRFSYEEASGEASRSQDRSSGEASSLLMDHLPKSLPLAVLKAGLYVFFVGTVGLFEIIKEMKQTVGEGQLVK